ncbi:MAG: cysteine synthase A [Bacteroidales bacterium]
MKANTVLDLIGNSPHIRLSRLFNSHEVWLKMEGSNPGGSIKDRIALAMIEDAEQQYKLAPGGTIIEPTSGNTGIGLALAGAVKGYRVILVMPDSMSHERRSILRAYGAELVLTPREQGMKGAIEKAERLAKSTANAYIPAQFKNPVNPLIHSRTTAREIIHDFPEGFDYLVTGIGTGGHISGVGSVLKEHFTQIKIFGVEPEESAVLSKGTSGPHPIQGIGAGFIPETLSQDILDRVIPITGPEAYEMTREIARTEGILAGISTGASLAAIHKLLHNIPKDSRILTFGYDTGERYLSVKGLF